MQDSISLPRSLAEFAAQNEAAREILSSGTSSTQAAAKVTELGYPISAPTVRQWRQRQALTVGNLASPYPRRRAASSNWQPRVDLGADKGSFATVPRVAGGGVPDDTELLDMMGLDPAAWSVVSESIRISRWQVARKDEEPTWLEAYRGDVRPRNGRSALSGEALEAILAGYPKPAVSETSASSILLVALADMQVGKPDQGGSEQLVQTFGRCVAGVTQRITGTLEGRVGTLLLAQLGDCIEGYVSQHGKLRTDISLTEAIRVTRRLLLHAIGTLAPLCDRMLVASVAGNHDETRRDVGTRVTDSWSLEVASGVADALTMSTDYQHVEFCFPEEGELSMAISVGTKRAPLLVGLTHGHVCGSGANSVPAWWRGQALGGQAVGQPSCRLLLTGHWHHLRIEAAGKDRYWIMAPALESGSDWWRHKSGDDSVAGVLSVMLRPGQVVPWDDLRIHS